MARRADFQTAVDQFSDWRWRLNNLYWITDKSGKRVRFEMNWTQMTFFEQMHYLNVLLKARQLGLTTFIQIFMLDACVFNRDIRAGTIAHIHVVGVTIIPTMTASSDSGRTVAGYTVPALWTTTLATVNNTIKASSRYAKVIDQLLAFTADTDPTKSPAAEMFPLGNVVGHPGNQDGVTTWDTIKLPASVPNGTRIMFEYQPGLWTSRTTYDRVDNGDGTADYKVIEVFATNVQDNAALLAHGMNLDVSSYVHPVLQGILRFVSRLPQSEKLKFYP
ncbi:hypothetical protein ACCS54_18005 [Rhizobium johnstonii]|uniref:Uncharacterized protein n=1 Tax=Rhizobium johnstonii (strain DSM 114642 / LMG 32736 / 3841) TaxID=216596 RepID=Q1MJX1_RHIJ3|nr:MULTISPECIES: hypothetical protein [Rhizobium]CAK06739.1 conserved hypothetical protein [Rhizobium johnstonii 3841]MBY5372837.1 hypothetical protein [Rhizobium leguminosarum]MBY5414755.1 hypothetical protein [Rhizobium leguminosarum]NEI94871.1 hypothetical protein [Rhizobium leguminosarum]NEJ81299.1 hypothetical protein [Rhizobium leguminosarum]